MDDGIQWIDSTRFIYDGVVLTTKPGETGWVDAIKDYEDKKDREKRAKKRAERAEMETFIRDIVRDELRHAFGGNERQGWI